MPDVLKNYKLLGGVAITKKNGELFMRTIAACDIQQRIIQENPTYFGQEKSSYKPWFVVRSFENGYQLKAGQKLKMGRTCFVVASIITGMLLNTMESNKEVLILNDKKEEKEWQEQQ